MSTPQKYVELTTTEPRRFNLTGYEIIGDRDDTTGRVLVLKRKEEVKQAAPAPKKVVKKRKRRTKAELEAARQATQSPSQLDQSLAEADALKGGK